MNENPDQTHVPSVNVKMQIQTQTHCSVMEMSVSKNMPFWMQLYYTIGLITILLFYLIAPIVCLLRKSGHFRWFPFYYDASGLSDYSLRKKTGK